MPPVQSKHLASFNVTQNTPFHVRTEAECACEPPGSGVREATAPGGASLASVSADRTQPPRLPRVSVTALLAACAWHSCTAPSQPSVFIFSRHDLSLFTTLFHNQVTRPGLVKLGSFQYCQSLCAASLILLIFHF